MKKYYPGNVVDVTVIGIKPYGIFVSLDEETVGLIHISEVSDGYVANINKVVKIGDAIKAKILDLDYKENKAKLSLKALKKRERYKYKKCLFSDEKINVEEEYFSIEVRLNDFVIDAKERLNIQ